MPSAVVAVVDAPCKGPDVGDGAGVDDYLWEQYLRGKVALRAELLLDFFVKELGPPVYNQAIRDAHDFVAEKLVDLEGEFYEPESERR